MDVVKLRKTARAMMAIGSTAALVGIGIMVHGEMEFGDAILVTGLILLAVGAVVLGQTPTGENNVD